MPEWFLSHASVLKTQCYTARRKSIRPAHVLANAVPIHLLIVSATRLRVYERSGEEEKNQKHCVLTIWAMIGLKNEG